MGTRWIVGSLLAVALAGGCSSTAAPSSPDYAVPPCITNTDCKNNVLGPICNQGVCVVCGSSADCATPKKCDNRTACVDCLGPGDCAPGQVCANKQCTTGCDAK